MGNGSRKLWLEHRKQDINDVKWNKIILSDRRLITWSLMSHFRYFHLYTKSNGRTLSSPYLCFTKSPKSKERNTPVDVEKPMGSYCLHANRFLYSSSQFNLIMQWKKNFICKKESHAPIILVLLGSITLQICLLLLKMWLFPYILNTTWTLGSTYSLLGGYSLS